MEKDPPITSQSGSNEDTNNLKNPSNNIVGAKIVGKFNLKGIFNSSSGVLPGNATTTFNQQGGLGIFDMKHNEKSDCDNNTPWFENTSSQDLQQSEKSTQQPNQFLQQLGGFKGKQTSNPLSQLNFKRGTPATAATINTSNENSTKKFSQLSMNELNNNINEPSAKIILPPITITDVASSETPNNNLQSEVVNQPNQLQSSSSSPRQAMHSRLGTQIPNGTLFCSSEPVTRVSSSSSQSRPTKRGNTIIIPVPSNASDGNQFGLINTMSQFQFPFHSESNINGYQNSSGNGNNITFNQMNSLNNNFGLNEQFQYIRSLNKSLNFQLNNQDSLPQFPFNPYPSNQQIFNQFLNEKNNSLDNNNNEFNQSIFQPLSSNNNNFLRMMDSLSEVQKHDSFLQRIYSLKGGSHFNAYNSNNEDKDQFNNNSNNELHNESMVKFMNQLVMNEIIQKNEEGKGTTEENELKEEHHMLQDEGLRQLKEEEQEEEEDLNDNSIVSSNQPQEKPKPKQKTMKQNILRFNLQNNDPEEQFASKYSKETGDFDGMHNQPENNNIQNDKQAFGIDSNFNNLKNSFINPFQANTQDNLDYSERNLNEGTQDGSKKTSSSRQSQHKNVYKNFGKELLRYVRAKRQQCVDLNHDEFEYLLDSLTGGLNDKDTKQTLPVQKKEMLQQLWTIKKQESSCFENNHRNSGLPTKKMKLDTQQNDGQQQENNNNNFAESIQLSQEDDNVRQDDSLETKVKKTFRQLSWEFFDHWAFQYVMNSRKLDKKEIHLKCIPSFLYGILLPKSLEAFKPIRETHQQLQRRQQELQNQTQQEQQQQQQKLKNKKEI